MQTKAGASANGLERLARVVPPLALVVLLALAVVLLAARSAHATVQAPPSTAPFALEDEAWELEEEACEAAEEEFEEGELGEEEVEADCEETGGEAQAQGTGSSAPVRCPLRSARARAVALAGGRRLKLTVGYTTYRPAGATVEVTRGTTLIGSFRRHLGRSGVLRIVKRLGGGPAPRRVVVSLRIAGPHSECAGPKTQKVRIQKR
jgi:hypothetical protein